MTLTFRPVAPQSRINRDNRTRIHKQLENELAQDSGGAPVLASANGEHKGLDSAPASKRTAHLLASNQFRLTGDTEHPPP